MKKLLIAAIAFLAFSNFAYAVMLVDMELTTAASGTSVNPNLGGSGTHSIQLPDGFTGPVYVWVYCQASTTNTVDYDDAFITGVAGTITESYSGVHGDMSWGTSKNNNTNKRLYIYQAGQPSGEPDYSAGTPPLATTNEYGDKEMGDPDWEFCALASAEYVDQGNFSSWSTLGHFTYTVKSGSFGFSQIIFTPDMHYYGLQYQYGLGASHGYEGGPTSPAIGPEQGYYSTGNLTIYVPEPATVILLGIGILFLLCFRRRM